MDRWNVAGPRYNFRWPNALKVLSEVSPKMNVLVGMAPVESLSVMMGVGVPECVMAEGATRQAKQ